ELTRLDAPRLPWVVVAVPPFHISTAEAYSKLNWRLTPLDPMNSIRVARAVATGSAQPRGKAARGIYNSFEAAVFAEHPELGAIKGQLLRAGAVDAALSGTGAAVFGL